MSPTETLAYVQQDTCNNVHNSTCYSKKQPTVQVSVSNTKDKQTVGYTYSGISCTTPKSKNYSYMKQSG